MRKDLSHELDAHSANAGRLAEMTCDFLVSVESLVLRDHTMVML